MTAPVDIAAAVELAKGFATELETCAARHCSGGSLKHGGVCGNCDGEGTTGLTIRAKLAAALIALADERRDIEQRTAEEIAAWVTSADLTTSDVRSHIAAGIRAGAWRTP